MSIPIHPLQAALDDVRAHVVEMLFATGLIGLLVCLVVINHLLHQRDQLRERNGALALLSYNQTAALDRSRTVLLSGADSIRLLGDSLRAVTKLALQEHQQRTGLDRALGIERKTTAVIRDSLAALQVHSAASVAPVTTDSAGVRTASYHVRQVPWTLDATDSLPAQGAGRLNATVAIDPATLNVSHGCEAPNKDGIRPARVLVTGPPWLSTTIVLASQDQAICPSPALVGASRPWWRPSLRPTLAAGLGYSGVQLPDGTIQSGKSIWAGVALIHWP